MHTRSRQRSINRRHVYNGRDLIQAARLVEPVGRVIYDLPWLHDHVSTLRLAEPWEACVVWSERVHRLHLPGRRNPFKPIVFNAEPIIFNTEFIICTTECTTDL